jgi:hypothetical protein
MAGAGLQAALDRVQIGVRDVADAIALQYFRHLNVEITPIEFRPPAVNI